MIVAAILWCEFFFLHNVGKIVFFFLPFLKNIHVEKNELRTQNIKVYTIFSFTPEKNPENQYF